MIFGYRSIPFLFINKVIILKRVIFYFIFFVHFLLTRIGFVKKKGSLIELDEFVMQSTAKNASGDIFFSLSCFPKGVMLETNREREREGYLLICNLVHFDAEKMQSCIVYPFISLQKY